MARIYLPPAVVLFLLPLLLAATPSPYQFGLRAGGPMPTPAHDCVDAQTRNVVRSAINQHKRLHPELFIPSGGSPRGGAALPLLPFYPIAGNNYGDIFHGGFVDLDPTSPGFHDYNCMPYTRDTHAGIDSEIRSFGEQVIGVPVLAALDGVVVFAQDGWPDMNLGGGTQGNIVAIDHGGWETSYYHLKNGSVAVAVNDVVKAGQPIGMIASSGNSFGPHLHFEIRDPTFTPYEPFAGPCRPGPSGWVDQLPTNLDSYLDDFALSYIPLDTVPGLPFEMPRTGQIGFEDDEVWFWIRGHNLPVDTAWRVQFFRPDGSEALLWEWFFFNAEIYRNYWFTFGYDIEDLIPDMHVITGTWRVRVEFNNALMVDAPFEVRPMRTADFNRAPEPITVSLDPPVPTLDDVIFCRVNTSLLIDDLDYDIVRYRYVWTADGTVIRDATHAGQADAIPHHAACPGSEVTCTVTPSDGTLEGPSSSTSTTLPGVAEIDLDCDCELTTGDIVYFVEALLSPDAFTGCTMMRADIDDDGEIDGGDVAGFVDAIIQ